MRSSIHYVIAWLLITLGIIHLLRTLPLEQFDLYILWDIGSGFTIIFSGLINIMYLNSRNRQNYFFAIITNFCMLALFCAAQIVIQGIQIYIGIFLYALSAFLTTRSRK